ncbi:MAG: hypothetical protein PHV18_04230 [Lachnospiraceae bacterium]|nr:hypothetical protein [Lachnospiraceae bacterium]
MVTSMNENIYQKPMSLAGKNTDAKPMGTYSGLPIPNASTFYEINTGAVYMYDEESAQWIAQ